MKKVFITNWVPAECLEKYTDIEFTYPTEEEWFYDNNVVLEKVKQDSYDGFLCIKGGCGQDVIEAAKTLKVVGNCGVGYDNIPVDYASEHGIYVTNAPNSVTEGTAELAFTLTCSVSRNIKSWESQVRTLKRCKSDMFDDRSVELFGKQVGIIGFGRIGKAYARRAAGFSMKLAYNDLYRLSPEEEERLNVKYLPLDELIATSDVITIHAPYVKENHHLISYSQFEAMKKSAILINCARGPIVDEAALIDALTNGKIRGAALDVYEFEPIISDKLLAAPNLTLTPHVGPSTRQIQINATVEALDGVVGVLRGEMPYQVVNKDRIRK